MQNHATLHISLARTDLGFSELDTVPSHHSRDLLAWCFAVFLRLATCLVFPALIAISAPYYADQLAIWIHHKKTSIAAWP